jgi:hypothetical protein
MNKKPRQPSPLPARSVPIPRWLAFTRALALASAAAFVSALAQTPPAPTQDPAAIG